MADETWRDSLSEEIQNLDTLKDIPDVETLAKSYDDAQRYIGRSIRIPAEDAENGQWDDFREKLRSVPGVVMMPGDDDSDGWKDLYSKLGRPEESSGYEIDDSEYQSAAHELGLTKDQATKLYSHVHADRQQEVEQRQQVIDGALETLKTKWGAEFERKGREAQQAVDYLDERMKAGGAFAEEMRKPGMGDSAYVIEMLSEVGSMLGEKTIAATDTSNTFGVPPGEALDRANAIIGDWDDPYHNASHPNHQSRVDHVRRLMEVAHPDG